MMAIFSRLAKSPQGVAMLKQVCSVNAFYSSFDLIMAYTHCIVLIHFESYCQTLDYSLN